MDHDDMSEVIGDSTVQPKSSQVRIEWPRGRELALFVALFLLTAMLFAYNVRLGYFLGDDSFISFRYARHLAAGRGLVWNPGERVEGYTNFLWVILMAGGAGDEIGRGHL